MLETLNYINTLKEEFFNSMIEVDLSGSEWHAVNTCISIIESVEQRFNTDISMEFSLDLPSLRDSINSRTEGLEDDEMSKLNLTLWEVVNITGSIKAATNLLNNSLLPIIELTAPVETAESYKELIAGLDDLYLKIYENIITDALSKGVSKC